MSSLDSDTFIYTERSNVAVKLYNFRQYGKTFYLCGEEPVIENYPFKYQKVNGKWMLRVDDRRGKASFEDLSPGLRLHCESLWTEKLALGGGLEKIIKLPAVT